MGNPHSRREDALVDVLLALLAVDVLQIRAARDLPNELEHCDALLLLQTQLLLRPLQLLLLSLELLLLLVDLLLHLQLLLLLLVELPLLLLLLLSLLVLLTLQDHDAVQLLLQLLSLLLLLLFVQLLLLHLLLQALDALMLLLELHPLLREHLRKFLLHRVQKARGVGARESVPESAPRVGVGAGALSLESKWRRIKK